MTEADSVQTGEMNGGRVAPGRPKGARPIRKRGYHRALKRGEWWAKQAFLTQEIDRHARRMVMETINIFYRDTPAASITFVGLSALLDPNKPNDHNP